MSTPPPSGRTPVPVPAARTPATGPGRTRRSLTLPAYALTGRPGPSCMSGDACRRPAACFPGDAIPSLVTASADWIERKSAEFADHWFDRNSLVVPHLNLGRAALRDRKDG